MTNKTITKTNKIWILAATALFAIVVMFIGVQLYKPAYSFKLDVNPSIEIVSNRLDKVLEVKPLNEDAKELLQDFEIKDKDLEDTIEDIADLMILTGYISGGQDNFLMITVNDKTADSKMINKVNHAIAAYLENKQIEATIINQTISEKMYEENTASELVARKISEIDNGLSYEEMANMSIKDLIEIAEARNIDPNLLFSNILTSAKEKNNKEEEEKVKEELVDTNNSTIPKSSRISKEEAKSIALEKTGGGKIVEFELDDDEYEIEIIGTDGYEYELEIDAYTGKIIEFEKEKIDDDKKVEKAPKETTSKSTSKPSRISIEEAKSIALNKTGGGKIVEFELDDDEYEIEIIGTDGYEYELEIDAYTGQIIEFEKEELDDDDDD